MREIYTDIEIVASPERIWQILINFETWHEWNPFVPEISGEPTIGSKLSVRVDPPAGTPMSFQSTVSRLQENSDFAWTGSVPIPWAFRGEHIFELRPIDTTRTKVIHREEFTGWMLPFLWKSLDTSVRAGFHLMNEALKNEVERTDR